MWIVNNPTTPVAIMIIDDRMMSFKRTHVSVSNSLSLTSQPHVLVVTTGNSVEAGWGSECTALFIK